MLVATKVRLYPTPEQAVHLERQFGAVRFVWNKALAIKTHRYRVHGQSLSAKHDLKPMLAAAKASRKYGWLKDFDSMALQQACLNLDRAFANLFAGHTRFPRFKRKHGAQSSYHCTGKIGIGEDWITVPKLPGRISAVMHRPVCGTLKSITISRTATGKFFAALLVENGKDAPALPKAIADRAVMGIDAGLTHLIVESDGRKTDNPKHLDRARHNLRRKQKSLSRKRKGSRNRAKARQQVASAHERVANARADFQHKLSKRLVDENQAIVVETLAVKNMLKNRHVARAISDAGWSGLIDKIAYKAERAGRHFVRIDRWAATTKTCSCCDAVRASLPLSVRAWTCESCGSEHDRDINAARNIKRLGILDLRAGGWHVPACGGLRKTTQTVAAADKAGNRAARAA